MTSSGALLSVALLASLKSVASMTIEYCSTQNTGSSFSPDLSIYQSNGRCEGVCNANYAFAILQDSSCWCSNYAPSALTNTSECDEQCPGYPPDKCGNKAKGLYGYIAMSNHAPSGTASVSSSTSTSSSTPGTATTTSSGSVVTVTIHNTPVVTSVSSSSSLGHHSSAMNGKTVAGIVVGTLCGVAALVALFFWLFIVRRRRSESPEPGYDASVQNMLGDGSRNSKGSQMSFVRGVLPEVAPAAGSAAPRMPTFTDNRLKPDVVLYSHDNRNSSVSLQDNEDYTRPVLRLTNPD